MAGARSFCEFSAVNARHYEVCKHQFNVQVFQNRKGIGAIRSFDNHVSETSQPADRDAADARVVFNNQNGF
jgi:hypothetical protein